MSQVEQFVSSTFLRYAESGVVTQLRKNPAGRQVLHAGRRTIRAWQERYGDRGRIEQWADSLELSRKAIERGALQKEDELATLIDVLSERPMRRVLEIGTARGGTLFALCHVAEADAHLISIDKPGADFGGGYSKHGQERMATYGAPGQRLDFLPLDSHHPETCERVEELLGGESLDFLLIDGDHTYDGVRRDWEMYAPLVTEGGLITFHDVAPGQRNPHCKVPDLWEELKSRFEHREIISPSITSEGQRWAGFGLIEWRPNELAASRQGG